MADPTKYQPGYSFSSFQASNPKDPLPADRVDREFTMLKIASSQAVDAIKDVRRSDGKLKNQIVSYDSLNADMKTRLSKIGYDADDEQVAAIIDGVITALAEQPDDDDDLEAVTAIQVDGTVVKAPHIARLRKYDVTNGRFRADPEQVLPINTDAIQAAIDAGADDVHAEVFIPFKGDGIYKVGASSSTQMLGSIASGPTIVHGPASTNVSLLLRSGVHLVLDDGVVIENQNPALTVLGLYKMQGGGVHGGHFRSIWNTGAQSGLGHGFFTFFDVSPNDDPMWDLQIEDTEVSNVGAYAYGFNLGFFKNNMLRRLWAHDCGYDAMDWKGRPRTDGLLPYGNSLETFLAQRHGQRTGAASVCGADIRGGLRARDITVLEVPANCVGLRLAPGISQGGGIDRRAPSQDAILSDFTVEFADPTATGYGLVLWDSGGVVENGRIRNASTGVLVTDSPSGWGSNEGSQVNHVKVEGARDKAFDANSDRVSFSHNELFGQIETFETNAETLWDGKSVYISKRPWSGATGQVWKTVWPAERAKLVAGVDYTVTGTNQITLTVPFASPSSADKLEMVEPTPIGFNIAGRHTRLADNDYLFVTLPKSVSIAAAPTLIEHHNTNNSDGFLVDYGSATAAIREARGPADNYDIEDRPKGTGGFAVRSLGRIAGRIVNAVANCVNWLQLQGSPTGAKAELVAVGQDANIHVGVTPKGTGNLIVPLANVPAYADDAAAAAGGVPVGGFYRTASALKIRAA